MPLQINLVNPSFRPRRTGLNSRTIALAGVATWLCLHVYGVSVGGAVKGLKARLAESDGRLAALKTELDAVKEAGRRREPDRRLVEEIARLEERLDVQRETLRALDTGGLGTSEGFSHYLAALARRAAEGVWLTRIAVDSATGEFQLRGRALHAEALHAWIAALGEEPALRPKRFGDLVVTARDLPPEGRATPSGAPADRAAPAVLPVLEFTLGMPPASGTKR